MKSSLPMKAHSILFPVFSKYSMSFLTIQSRMDSLIVLLLLLVVALEFLDLAPDFVSIRRSAGLNGSFGELGRIVVYDICVVVHCSTSRLRRSPVWVSETLSPSLCIISTINHSPPTQACDPLYPITFLLFTPS